MSKALLQTFAIFLCAIFGGALSSVSFAQKSSVSPEMGTGMWRGRPVTYEVKNGRAIYQGDIILDHLQPMPRASAADGGAQPQSVGIAYPSTMWPKVGSVYQVPYVITSDGGDTNLVPAINQFNSTFTGLIQWVARTTETNYVNIDLNSFDGTGECEATEGDANIGPQPMTGSGACTLATILHEMGHEIGLYHEQSRSDRDTYITVNYQSVIKGSRFNFDMIQDNVQNLTLYDYASVMQYPAFSFSRNGGPAIESIPAGMPLSNAAGYSAGDIEGVERLYGAPPTAVTVTSNPPGLQVIVDGSTITAPQVFNWALNSTHTLNVPTNAQTLSGVIENSTVPTTFTYAYGRWNDNALASHTITVTPGNGELPFPSTSPQVSTYSANFIQVVPYTAAIFPFGDGSVTPSPTPQSFPGVSGVYFTARQQVTLTATPIGPFQFYEFNNANFFLPGGVSANPKTFYVPDTGLAVNTTAEFAPVGTVYTVGVTPDAFSSNLYIFADSTFWVAPKNFSPTYDSTWTPGSMHTVNVDTIEQPYSSNSRYAFSSWSDAGAQSHSITLPGSGNSTIATFVPQFLAGDNFSFPPCGGNATLTPASPTNDGFYPSGQVLTYTATPDATWTFAGWTYDLTGTTNPDSLTATDETLAYANFNTTNTPLTLASLSPNSIGSGGASFTLTLNGTGFTSGSFVSVNGAFLTPTFVSFTQLTVTVPATDITNPTAFQVYVENFPVGWTGCANFGYQPFFVFKAPPSPIVTPTPTTLTFASRAVGTTSPSQPTTVTNSGAANTSISVASTGDFAQTNTCGTTLNAGANCTVNVMFTPTVTGTRTGTISITDTASNSPQTVSLTGTGTATVVTVTATPASLTFASQAVGTTSASKPVTVRNTGTAATSVTIGSTGDFAQTNTCPATLNGGANCVVSVTFSPTAAGTRTGTITVTDAASNSPQTVNLTGTGTATVATITVTPASLTFTSQAVGTTSASKPLTVKNTGTASTSISIVPTGDFAQTNTCGTTLNAGANCTVNVTFTPTVAGTRTGTISIADTASNSPQIANLTGTGTGSTITVTVTPASLTFTSQAVGTTSASKPVTVKNTGTGTTTLSIASTGDFAQTNTCAATLAAKGSCTVNVTFTPTVAGSRTGTISVTDMASNSPQLVNLTGTGTGGGGGGSVTVTPATLTFTSQAVGTTSTGKTVTVKNAGSTSTTISITSSGNFGQTNNCGTSLAAGASCTITSTFSPTAVGSVTGAITVSDTATNSPQLVSLTGTAVSPVTLSPGTLPFGSAAVGTTTAAQTVTVTNNLATVLTFSFAASGNYAAVGSGTSPCGASLTAATSCTISVTFTPTANGAIDGALTVAYSAAFSPQEVKLTGSGTGAGTSPLKFTPATLAFSSQAVGTSSAAKSVTVQNTSTSTVTISSIATTGDFSEAGSGATPCGAIALAASASCTLSVTFSPSISGALQGALVISDNAAIAQQVLNITGTAVVPVTITPASLTFTGQTVGTTSAAQTLTITNNSSAALSVSGFSGSGDFAVIGGGTTPCGASIPANSACTLNVTFTPTATGTIKGAATITDAASSSPQVVKLTGTGD